MTRQTTWPTWLAGAAVGVLAGGLALMAAACGGSSGEAGDAAADGHDMADLPGDAHAGDHAQDAGDAAPDSSGMASDSSDAGADKSATEAGGAGGCGDADTWTSLKHLPPVQLHDQLASKDFFFINVHVPRAGEIPGTDVHIPYTEVDAIEAFVGHDPCASIVLYCLTGGMSQYAGTELITRGYLRVSDLQGGMMAWRAAGYPLMP